VGFRWLAVFLLIGMAMGAVLSLVIPPVSRRAGVRRALRDGALWAGLATLDAARQDQAPVVAAALSVVRRPYGQRFSGTRDERPVAGHLYVFTDRLEWQPWFYLGPGKPRSWVVPRQAITGWEVVKPPPPAMSGYQAVLRTDDGPISCLVVDGDGLLRALEHDAAASAG
jgi:hypothetical protein